DGLKKGVNSVGFCIDGKKAIGEADMKTLLKGIDLNKIEVNFVGCCCATTEIIKSFISVAKSQKVNADNLYASFDFDPLRVLNQTGAFCSDKSLDQLKDCIEAAKDYKRIRVIGVEAYSFNDAGSNISQELGFGLAMGSEYINKLKEMGLSADDAARRIKFTFSVGSIYFMEIAKFRAARLLWANIVKAYGSEKECCQKMRIHAVTSGWSQTVYDPYINLLRGTTAAMSAAISGVDSLEVLPFDYAFRKPSEFSNRIARNTQSVLKEESHFNKVVDPSAGSYYIENLTQSVENAAWALFTKVEEMGGYVAAFKAGFIQTAIKETSAKRDENIATRREVILGSNQYPNFTEVIDKDVTKEVVTRNPVVAKGTKIGEPLEKYRGAQAFEAMRFATDKSPKTPVAYMVTFGNLAMCRARAQFASNFFAVAGFKVVDNNRFSSPEEGVKAALEAKADIIVACSSDEEYAEAVPQIASIAGNKGIVVVAGDPACKDELISKGITNFINVKSNVLETLKEYQVKLGIK
ncbi:MAG: methylmalonyl-CoA mutase family protein, partial [Bacteroidales bacterium]